MRPPRPSFLPDDSGSGVRSGRSQPLASIASLLAGRNLGRRPPLRSVLALVGLLGASSAWGLGVELPADQLVGRAAQVLLGTVTQLQSLRVGPGGLVCTVVRLQTEQSLKGPLQPGPVEILTPGGLLPAEDLGVWFSEQARFQPGERVLVALERSPLGDGRWCVVNGAQGKVSVGRDLRPFAAESALGFFQRVAPGGAPAARTRALVPYDFLSVATHEQGHFTGLGDLYNNASQGSGTNGYQECMGRNNQQKTMFGFIGTGATDARDLHPADRLGQEWLYGRLALPIASGANNENLFDYFCSSAPAPITCSSQACTPKIHWNSLPASYRIHTADFLPEHVQLLQQGFGVWDAVASGNFAARYAGDSTIDVSSTDDRVPVLRVSNPDSAEDRMMLGGSALAVTSFAWIISTGNMTDADITFNQAIEFSPQLPAAAISTPTPVEEDGGGGCGTAGAAMPPPASGLGSLLLAAALAAGLLRRPRQTARSRG